MWHTSHMNSICLKWTTRKYVCEQCKKRCQIHINIKNIAKMNIMNIEDEGRQEDLHSRWTTPCRRHLNSTPAEVTKDWCHLFLVKYCKYFPINFKIHGTLPPFRKNGDLSKILIVCISVVVAQQMFFFSANLFMCFYLWCSFCECSCVNYLANDQSIRHEFYHWCPSSKNYKTVSSLLSS